MGYPRRIPRLQGESIRIFREAIRAEETWLQYERRFWRFHEWLVESPDGFLEKARADRSWAESKIMGYIVLQKERVRKGEISEATVPSFKKPVKLFLEMNDVTLNWTKINKMLPSVRRFALDRAPTIEELRRLVRYPDMRVEVIVLVMASSGIRVGAWDKLKIGDVHPIQQNGKLVAAKLVVYKGDPEEYITFMTPEAYESLQNYLHYREIHGERLASTSPLLRNMFNTSDRGVNWKGEGQNPKPLKHSGVKHLVERALWRNGLRSEKKRRHEFATDHGFRKFFKTRAEQMMKPINVEWLMGHSTGISDSYYRPTENELLEDYLKAVPLLTVSEVEEVRRENVQLKQEIEQRISQIEAALTHLISEKELQLLSLAANRKEGISQ